MMLLRLYSSQSTWGLGIELERVVMVMVADVMFGLVLFGVCLVETRMRGRSIISLCVCSVRGWGT